MPNVSSFGAQTDNAVVSGTVTDRQMIIPEVPPQGLMSVGPRVTPNFVKPREWNAQTTYHFFDAVRDAAGNAYIATKPVVPAGTPLTNEDYWFLWADPDTRFDDLNETVKTFNQRITQNTNDIATKAPINHASEETVYGIGNELNYGHVRLAVEDTPMTSDANAGIAATPALVGKYAPSKNVFNVKHYGAIGDGAHDDTEAFKSAINAAVDYMKGGKFEPPSKNIGAILRIPSGVYNINDTLTIPASVPYSALENAPMCCAIAVVGDSDFSSVLMCGNSNFTLFEINGRYFSIKNLYIYNAYNALKIAANCPYQKIENLYIYGLRNEGINIADDCFESDIKNVKITQGNVAFKIGKSTTMTITNCYANNQKQAGFRLNKMVYSTLESCSADSNSTDVTAYDINQCSISLISCGTEAHGTAVKIDGLQNNAINISNFHVENARHIFDLSNYEGKISVKTLTLNNIGASIALFENGNKCVVETEAIKTHAKMLAYDAMRIALKASSSYVVTINETTAQPLFRVLDIGSGNTRFSGFVAARVYADGSLINCIGDIKIHVYRTASTYGISAEINSPDEDLKKAQFKIDNKQNITMNIDSPARIQTYTFIANSNDLFLTDPL